MGTTGKWESSPRHTNDTYEPRRVLWTGGFDSTFRVCQLLLVEGIDVQPIYVIDPRRRSTLLELETMARMREALLRRTRAILWPTRIYNRLDYDVPAYLWELYNSIKARSPVGSQHLWLAAIAEAEGWNGVELGTHRHPEGTPEWHKIVFRNPPYSEELSSDPGARLFTYWKNPLLHLSKQDMYEEAVREGFDDILLMRWFCHRPVRGRACGICSPCLIARRNKMAYKTKFVSPPLRWGMYGFNFGRTILDRLRRRA